jgi:hypothetical protein
MKVLYVSTYYAHGDLLSTNGLMNFLSLHYDLIFILAHWDFISVIEDMHSGNNKIKSMSYDYFMLLADLQESHKFDEVEFLYLYNEEMDTCLKTQTSVFADCNITISDFLSKNISNIVYDKNNTIGKKLGFNISKVENLDLTSSYYNRTGLPTEIKFTNFNFGRFYDDENTLYNSLNLPSEYAVICEYNNIPEKNNGFSIRHPGNIEHYNEINRQYIKSDKLINLHLLSKKYFDVVKVIENASEVHLIENSFSLLVYFLQMTGRMKKIPINFHSYVRKEEARKEFIKMYLNPKLDNWNFIE